MRDSVCQGADRTEHGMGHFVVDCLAMDPIFLICDMQHGRCCSEESGKQSCGWENVLVEPERDAGCPELLSVLLEAWTVKSIFANPEQIKECNVYQVSNSFLLGCGIRAKCLGDSPLRDQVRDCQVG